MSKINVVIVNTDKFYLNKLKVYILKKYSRKFNLHCITDLDVAKVELEKFENGVLLINEELYTKNLNELNFDEIIILSETLELGEIDGNKVLSKYTAANILCDDIMSIYKNKAEYKNNGEFNMIDTKVSMIFSPIGKSGSSSIASSIAILLSKLGKKVLYINLENLKTTRYFFKARQYGDILFREDEELKFMPKLQKGIMKDEITGVYCFDYEVEEEDVFLEFSKILEFIVSEKIFSLVIIDMNSGISSFNRSLLNISENVLVPILADNLSLFKLKKYLEKYNTSKKMTFILNKAKNEMGLEQVKNRGLKIEGYINFDINIEQDKYQNLYESMSFMYDIDKVIKNVNV